MAYRTENGNREKRGMSLLEVSKQDELILYDASCIHSNKDGKVMRLLYDVSNYADFDEKIMESINGCYNELTDTLSFLAEPNMKTVEEAYKEIECGYQLFRGKQRNYNRMTDYIKRCRKVRDVSEERQIFGDLCYLWSDVSKKSKADVIRRSHVCELLSQAVIYLESYLQLKQIKYRYYTSPEEVSLGNEHEDFHTDEKLIGTAWGKAIEGKSVSIVTRDTDFRYLFPVCFGIISAAEDGFYFAKNLKDKPVKLYVQNNETGKYELLHSTDCIEIPDEFKVHRVDAQTNEVIKTRIAEYLKDLNSLINPPDEQAITADKTVPPRVDAGLA